MGESLRQKRVSSLLKEELSQQIRTILQDPSELITITRVHMTKDLRTAHVYLSLYGENKPEKILDVLNDQSGFLRKAVASKIKLKYNPLLIFSLDPVYSEDERITKILKDLEKNDRKQHKKDR